MLIEDSQVPIGICVIKLGSNSFFFLKKKIKLSGVANFIL